MTARKKTASSSKARRPVTRTPNPTPDQLRKALWRQRRLRKGLCADCGTKKRLKGITRCAACALKKRRLNRRLRECKAWRRGSSGARPTYTDAQLRKLAKTQAVVVKSKPARKR